MSRLDETRNTVTTKPVTANDFRIRIEGAKEAANRTRFVLTICVILSLCIIMCAWNAEMSWHRGFLVNSEVETKTLVKTSNGTAEVPAASPRRFPSLTNEVTRLAQQQLVQDYVSSISFTIPLLGVRINSADIAPLGSASMLVCSIWLLFAARRENHIVARLMIDTQQMSSPDKTTILHGVLSSMVFITTDSDHPIRSLQEIRHNFNDHLRFRWMAKILFYLPGAAPLFAIFGDLWSIFRPAPFRDGNPVLWHVFGLPEWRDVIIWDLATILICLVNLYFCTKAVEFCTATQQILKEYNTSLQSQADPSGVGEAASRGAYRA